MAYSQNRHIVVLNIDMNQSAIGYTKFKISIMIKEESRASSYTII